MDISSGLSELRELLLRRLPDDVMMDAGLTGVRIGRRSQANRPEACLYTPVIALLAGGRKHSAVGAEEYDYGPGDCLLVGMDMPALFYVSEASADDPYLGVSLRLDPAVLSELADKGGMTVPSREEKRAVALIHADNALVDAFIRLVRLLDCPHDAPYLLPLIVREIHYRALLSPAGPWLAGLCREGTSGRQVAEAAAWIREHFRLRLNVEVLARQVGMGVSTLHHHFRAMTAMSPLQYQKRLRLMEARRLMVLESCDAASAGFSVGYESVSQFSREYRRLFGLPPGRDAEEGRRKRAGRRQMS